MGKLAAFVRLTRIEHGAMAAFAALVGYAVASGGWDHLDPPSSLVAVAVVVAVEAGLFAFNDIFNLEEDRVNAPHRPLVRGEVSFREAWSLALSALAAGVALSAWLGAAPFVIALLAALSGMAYNVALKKRGFWGNLIVAADTALPFPFGASIASGFRVPWTVSLLTAMAFLAALGREALKGVVDVEGDRRAGVRTLAVTRGPRFAAALSSALTLAAVVLSTPLFLLLPPGKLPMYAALVLPADALFTYVALSMLRDAGFARRGRQLTLAAMLLGIFAFAAVA